MLSLSRDRAAALEQLGHRRAQADEPRLGHIVGQHQEAFVEELLALRGGQDVGRMLQHVLLLHGVLRVVGYCCRLCLALGVSGNGCGERIERRAVSPAGFFLRHRRADEAHRQAAHHALAVADRHTDALQAAAARQHGEGIAVAPDPGEGSGELGVGASRRDGAGRRAAPRPNRRRARRGPARSTGSGCGAAARCARTTSGSRPRSNGGW